MMCLLNCRKLFTTANEQVLLARVIIENTLIFSVLHKIFNIYTQTCSSVSQAKLMTDDVPALNYVRN